jgi:putative addiction module antidote
MTLELKLRKVGNSLGAVFPKEALARFNAGEGDSLFITEAPDGYRITAGDPNFAKQMASAEKLMRRYRNTLRELAK